MSFKLYFHKPEESVDSLILHNMHSLFVYTANRLKQMPTGLALLTRLSMLYGVIATGALVALSLRYVPDGSQARGGFYQTIFVTIVSSAIFVFGFLRASWWSRPLVMLWITVAFIREIVLRHAKYSILDYLGGLLGIGLLLWILYFQHGIRDYYAKAFKPVA